MQNGVAPFDAKHCTQGIKDEVDEVIEELKPGNAVHLEDELSDILWNYFCLLTTLENDQYIRSVGHVFSHAHNKYVERFSAVESASEKEWTEIKNKQKQELKEVHQNYKKENNHV